MGQKKSMLDLHRVSVEIYKDVKKLPVTVVLDNVRSEMNVGSVFRTADAFLINRIYLCEQVHDSVSLEQFVVNDHCPVAIILGNEVKGVSQDVVDCSDVCIEIPQHGTKHSLNISCCAAIVMWKFYLDFRP